MDYPIRINKYIRDIGLASRREADTHIAQGHVLVNGKRAKTGMMINEHDVVTLPKAAVKKHTYLIYYKPRGLSTQAPNGTTSVITEWKKKGLYPIGRLDKESEGLMILTNDGRITRYILDANSAFEKEYIVKVTEELRNGISAIFAKGMETETFGKLLPARAQIMDKHTMRIALHEGKRHQIRIMLSELGYTVTNLKRVRIGHLRLGYLRPGAVRELTPKESDRFFTN